MSATRQVTIWCDICATEEQRIFGQTDHLSVDTSSVTEARAQAAQSGWTRVGRRDICLAHSQPEDTWTRYGA